MANNLYQLQPLKLEYGNLAQNINREELENSVKNPVERNKLYQLITGIKDHIEPTMNTIGNAIFGKQEPATIVENNDGTASITVNNNRKGGVLGFANDIAKGYQENVSTPYAPENMLPRQRSFAQRFGEGLGTATRLLDNSAVRGAIAYGLSKSLGDNNALEQGLTAASMNMAAKNNDKLYRNDLIQYEQNALMNSPEFAILAPEERQRRLSEIANKYNNIRSYITEDMYKNILASRQMQDNVEWRKANLKAQQMQNAIMNNYRNQQIAIDREKLAASENKIGQKELARAKQANSTVNMINRALKTVEDNPDAFGFSKGVLPSDAVDRLDPKGTEARAIINSVTAEYRKYLTGAQMSDKERQYYEKFLPNPRDNAKITTQKLNGMLMVISAREGLNTEEVGTIATNNAQPKTNDLPATPKKIGKYKVEVQ